MRLMSVHAHPDDEASKGAATVAKYVAEGHRVRIVTCTGGERGSILNPRLVGDSSLTSRMPEVRRQEMDRAIAAIGAEHTWLGFIDSGLPEGDPPPPVPDGSFAALPLGVTVPVLVAELRSYRPHVVVTYNEEGGYPHPDHIMTHRVTMAALDAAADPGYRPGLGEPWEVSKVYYDVSFSRRRLLAFHQALVERGIESPFGDRLDGEWHERPVTARIDVADWFPQRDDALRAHATQIDPDGFFFLMPRDLERELWPWEEFELARAAVPTRELEESLFEGIEDD
ncbi:MAG TPA: mycothiol conjugate amidase Mca [Actinomycetaceae bacterium]|nr:mycothiol conjugate amidase Mca [Actinomycetaceae bacterium]